MSKRLACLAPDEKVMLQVCVQTVGRDDARKLTRPASLAGRRQICLSTVGLAHYQVGFQPLLYGIGLALVLTCCLKETGPAARRTASNS